MPTLTKKTSSRCPGSQNPNPAIVTKTIAPTTLKKNDKGVFTSFRENQDRNFPVSFSNQ
jgi:hypothetical protein